MGDVERERLGILFEQALGLTPADRPAFLQETCGSDAALYRELESLLTAAKHAPVFFEALAQEVVDPSFDAFAVPQYAREQIVSAGDATPSLSHYEVLEKLGGGGMGIVYKARDTRLGRLVALKFLPRYLTENEEAKARFVHEARAASALDHPGIAVLHEVGETQEGQLYLAMAYYEGETLKEKIDRGPLPVGEAVDLACQIAAALAAAHDGGIVHRDVKPANVLVSKQGIARLVDFGAAKVLGTELTKEGLVLGTVAYMSPEQTSGGTVDHRTDLWSLGVVLYEMLTGRRPFGGESDGALIHAIRHDEPERIERLRSDVSEALSEVVARCLAKAPAHRYADARALLEDLESIRAHGGAHLVGRRHGRIAARIAGLIAVLVILGGGAFYFGQRATDIEQKAGEEFAAGSLDASRAEHRLAVLPFDNVSQDSATGYFAAGWTDELTGRLAKIEGLRVIARTSVAPVQDAAVAEIGRELGVEAVLKGTVRKEGDRVNVSVLLHDAEGGAAMWSENYEMGLENVFDVQRVITGRVTYALDVREVRTGQRRLGEQGTHNPEAYDLYLRGQYFLNHRDYSVESLEQSRRHFERALDNDPMYAKAWTGLANVYTLLGSLGVLTPDEAHPRARAAAEQALALDEELAEAHNALAATLSDYYWDWEAAGRHFRRAIELDPSYATARQWYATNVLQMQGRFEEAIVETREAAALDPLSPVRNYAVGQALYFARRFEEAEAHLQRIRELYPRFPLTYIYIAQIASLQGRHTEAVEAAEAAHALYEGEAGLSAILGYAYARAGRSDEARALLRNLRDLAEEQPLIARTTSFHEAYIYLGLGEYDAALSAFERAYEARVMYMSWVGIEPIFDPLRSEARFEAIIEKMGLAG